MQVYARDFREGCEWGLIWEGHRKVRLSVGESISVGGHIVHCMWNHLTSGTGGRRAGREGQVLQWLPCCEFSFFIRIVFMRKL